MKDWITSYIKTHAAVVQAIPHDALPPLIEVLRDALAHERQIFVCGNGGSAANASHFVTDLGKGSSDKVGRGFRCMSLNDNVSWMTALGNDYSYEDVFVRQLANYGKSGDVLFVLTVSGNSPNIVKAVTWAREHGLRTIALVGGKRGRAAEIADVVVAVDSTHYGQVEDVHMTICHLLCYAFMENPEWANRLKS
jgi:D-sedoheptulose 7-phosphate isomerase